MSEQKRHRIDIGDNVYEDLDREARWLGISPAALATMLCREGLERLQQGRSLAARIVAEGSPSPTLAELQRQTIGRLAAEEGE